MIALTERAQELERIEREANSRRLLKLANAHAQQVRVQERARIVSWLKDTELPNALAAAHTPLGNSAFSLGHARKLKQATRVTVGNLTLSLSDWAKHLGVCKSKIYSRAEITGSFEAAIADIRERPRLPKRQPGKYLGKTVAEWSQALNVTAQALYQRSSKLGSMEAAIQHYIQKKTGGSHGLAA